MFDNIGGKIKILAKVICLIGILGSIFAGIVVIANGHDLKLGVGIMLVGSLFSWIISFFIYGFGQLIEKTEDTDGKMTVLLSQLEGGITVRTLTEKAKEDEARAREQARRDDEMKKAQATLDAYRAAVSKMNSAQRPEEFSEAAAMFGQLGGYRDSNELAKKCRTASDQASMQAQ